MPASQTIEQLHARFNAEAARDVSATYLFLVRGEGGGDWLTTIANGQCEFVELNGESPAVEPDCKISVNADDLEMILSGRMSAMTAALSGVLAIEGELGLAMQLVPIFFQGEASFI